MRAASTKCISTNKHDHNHSTVAVDQTSISRFVAAGHVCEAQQQVEPIGRKSSQTLHTSRCVDFCDHTDAVGLANCSDTHGIWLLHTLGDWLEPNCSAENIQHSARHSCVLVAESVGSILSRVGLLFNDLHNTTCLDCLGHWCCCSCWVNVLCADSILIFIWKNNRWMWKTIQMWSSPAFSVSCRTTRTEWCRVDSFSVNFESL